MSGFAKGGVAIVDGQNLAIAGLAPAGIAIGGSAIWAGEQWELLTQTVIIYTTAITNAIDTTGADLIIIFGAALYGFGISDSENNNWLTGIYTGNGPANTIFYCINPNVSAQHTFEITSGNYTSMIVAAFKSSSTPVPGPTGTANAPIGVLSMQLSPITLPSGSLVVAGMALNADPVGSIDSGFDTIISGAGTYPLILTYRIADGSTLAPTWTMVANSYNANATIMAFTH